MRTNEIYNRLIINSNKFKVSSQFITLLSEIGLGLISIYLPFYAYKLGASQFEVGLIGAAQSITYIFMPFFTGLFSDKIGQKRMLLIGFGIISSTYIFYFLIRQPVLFIPIRAAEGLGWSFVWPSLETLAGGEKGRLRIYNIMWGVGSAVAPYMGGILSQATELTNIFTVAIMMSLINFILSITIPSKMQSNNTGKIKEFLFNSRNLPISLFLYSFLYAFTSLIIFTFFPIYSYTKNISIANTGYILTVMNIGRLLAFIIPIQPKGIFGEEKISLICTIFVGTIPLLIFFDALTQLLYIGLFFLGFFSGILFSTTLWKIMRMAGERKGYYAGIFESVLGTGFFLGPMLGGIVANITINYAFLLPTVFTVLFLVLATYLHTRRLSL